MGSREYFLHLGRHCTGVFLVEHDLRANHFLCVFSHKREWELVRYTRTGKAGIMRHRYYVIIAEPHEGIRP